MNLWTLLGSYSKLFISCVATAVKDKMNLHLVLLFLSPEAKKKRSYKPNSCETVSVPRQVSVCPSCWLTSTVWCPFLCVEEEAVESAEGRGEVSASTLMRTTVRSQVRSRTSFTRSEKNDPLFITCTVKNILCRFLQWQMRGEPWSPRASVRAVWTGRSAVWVPPPPARGSPWPLGLWGTRPTLTPWQAAHWEPAPASTAGEKTLLSAQSRMTKVFIRKLI